MIGAIVAAIMAASFFMPWVEFFGTVSGPDILFDDGLDGLINAPWQVSAFLASFALAALASLLALMGRTAGIVMLIAGATPFGLIAQQVLSVKDQVRDAGFPMPRMDNPAENFDLLREIVQIGLPAYFISAAMLVVIGVVRMLRAQ